MLKGLAPGLLAISVLLCGEERMQIGIRLEAPPTMPHALIRALMEETGRHWSFPALRLKWHTESTSCCGEDDRLLVVRLVGACSLTCGRPTPPRSLGYTHVSDGRVLPFIAVDCSAVASSISRRPAGTGVFLNLRQYAQALAAVLTHEMVHALTASSGHSSFGIMRAQLSASDLIEPELKLAADTVGQLEKALGVRLSDEHVRLAVR
jgi:hypothetical protein